VSRIGTDELRDAVLDEGSFVSWDTTPVAVSTSDSYTRELTEAHAASGRDESVLTGEGRVCGRRVAVVVCEFDFLAGSIGVAAAERITVAVQRATAQRLPLLASPCSGGTRMQEGTVAFLQMVKIAAAVTLHKEAHLPYLVYLRHPTTGGVFASWGSLGHITIAQPGALIGFLGPRVYEQLYGEPFPPDVQTAENLQRYGVIDAVVPLGELRDILDRALTVVADDAGPAPEPPWPAPLPDVPAWDSVLASRRPNRPGVQHLLRYGCTDQVLLSGTGQGEAATMLLALARFAGQPAVLLGQQRVTGGLVGPAALREARRGMTLAAGLRLPLVLVIDTAGPALSAEAEQGGLAGQIAHCLAELVTLDTPTVSVLLGQGSGGPALAMVPADRVLAALHGWLAPLPPEGASAIVFRDTAHAPELSAEQGIRSVELLASGIVDAVVPERPDAADEPVEFCERLSAAIAVELNALATVDDPDRTATRLRRYRNIGLR
jgi:acetyl-CoA carboxylase carboxyl transferase subunit beta